MSMRRAIAVLLPLLLLLAGFRQAPLIDPDPIAIPSSITPQNVVKAIEISLLRRGWTADHKEPGGMDGILHLREHEAVVHISWDARQIRIKYVSSVNLKYEVSRNGEREIHKNYLGWIQNLVTDIKANLIVLSE